jgi:hypothetical protein
MTLTLWAILLVAPLTLLVIVASLLAYARRLDRIEQDAAAAFERLCNQRLR